MRSTKLPSWIERLLGLGSTPVPPHVFALTEHELRYAAFTGGDRGVVLSAHGAVALEDGTFFEGPLGGPVRDPDSFAELLSSLLADATAGGATPEEATLVLPDRWLRLVFAEISELPDSASARLEALRFKLRHLVPFRVEDLRVVGLEVEPLADQNEPRRVLLSFAVSTLLDQLEGVFRDAGIRLGLIANESLCLLGALPEGEAVSLLLATGDGYSLLVTRGGQPVLYRHKTLDEHLDAEILGAIVGRDLELTKSFLEERVGAGAGREVWVAADDPERWANWIELGLGATPRVVSATELPSLDGLPSSLPAHVAAPLYGAAMQEVA